MEIVTGHRGTPHVTPYKVRDFNIGIVGAEDYVMNGGSELEAQLVSNNRIDIKDGSICMQGTHAVIPKNINDELTIENGMQGEKRIDLIVARYEKVADSGVESVNTVVLQGTPSKESPIVPGHVVGDIRNGDLKHEMPLYEVELDGINVIEVRPVFKKIVSAAEQQKMIELLNGKITPLTDSVLRQPAQNYTAGQKYYFDADGWVYFECQTTNADGYCRFRIFNESDAEIFGFQANATATQKVAMQSGVYPVKKGWYTQLGQYQSAIYQRFYFIKE